VLDPRQDPDVTAALRRYEHLRAARTARIVARSRRIASMTTTRNAAKIWLRRQAMRIVPTSVIAKSFLLAAGDDPHRELRREVRS
jgi:2-polyprenyl-6-methoxyphenol hydroxylase-like FAD-dependent oxidoreductase